VQIGRAETQSGKKERFATLPLEPSTSSLGIMENIQVSIPLPVLPAGWSAENGFKALSTLSPAIQRNIEPVGPHFLAHARRKR
jgi:hypothetical protein